MYTGTRTPAPAHAASYDAALSGKKRSIGLRAAREGG